MDYIKQTVTELINEYGTSDPYRLAQAMHILVDEVPFHDIGGLTMELAGQSTIMINSNFPDWHKRFILAHELGHRKLSPRGAGYFFVSEHTLMGSKVEYEANRFAVELLTGQEPEAGETLEQFAVRVGVPVEMMMRYKSVNV
ncbi:MAG: ImmA/IrrE family metallo-endopeptidase [Firmicutes bacterium]|nr:ImmA/IrrE family metallo-endopeptidase [Bacillota bacterium]